MIGIFDSGVGGMTVAKAIENALPGYDTLYFGDLARTPYGSKSPETILRYARENTEFLLSQGAQLIVVACNSAASVASDVLRKEYNVPLFEVITPAVEKAVAETRNKRIGIIGTRATVRSAIYQKKIESKEASLQVYSQACPLLVPLVEEGWLKKPETKRILRQYLAPLKNHQVDTLVLGCTHYPLLRPLILPRIGKKVSVIDSSEVLAGQLVDFIENSPDLSHELSRNGQHQHFVSDLTSAAQAIADKIFQRRVDLQLVDSPELK